MDVITQLTDNSTCADEYNNTLAYLLLTCNLTFSFSQLREIFIKLTYLLNHSNTKKYISIYRIVLSEILIKNIDLFVAILCYINQIRNINFHETFKDFIGGTWIGRTYFYTLDMNVSEDRKPNLIKICTILQTHHKFDLQNLPMKESHKKIINERSLPQI